MSTPSWLVGGVEGCVEGGVDGVDSIDPGGDARGGRGGGESCQGMDQWVFEKVVRVAKRTNGQAARFGVELVVDLVRGRRHRFVLQRVANVALVCRHRGRAQERYGGDFRVLPVPSQVSA